MKVMKRKLPRKCIICGKITYGTKARKFCGKTCCHKWWRKNCPEIYLKNRAKYQAKYQTQHRERYRRNCLDIWWLKNYGVKRSKIVERLKTNKCLICNSDKRLFLHHRDANPENKNINNFVLLCNNCHQALHKLAKQKEINFTILKQLVEGLILLGN